MIPGRSDILGAGEAGRAGEATGATRSGEPGTFAPVHGIGAPSGGLVVPFAQAPAPGSAARRALPAGADHDPLLEVSWLGQKGAGLLRMARLGLPVPPGFVLTTDVWRAFRAAEAAGQKEPLPPGLWDEIRAALAAMSAQLGGTRLGDPARPLLVAVRSGAAVSMPGIMDSVLNIGLGPATLAGLSRRGGRRFALDCYRRLIQQYGQVVLGIGRSGGALGFELSPLEALHAELRQRRGVYGDDELSETDLEELCQAMQAELRARCGAGVPDDAEAQLRAAIVAVLRSHDAPRAQEYRRSQALPEDLGTAVTVQAMVFGNLAPGERETTETAETGRRSAAGVAFTRDPATGEARLYGEYIEGAQGEDVVSGRVTPRPLAEMAARMPDAHAALASAARTLERHLGDMQDIEFTVEAGQLYLLQTRPGKRSGRAMVRIAVEQVAEGALTPRQALGRIDAARLAELLHPTLDLAAAASGPARLLTRGLPASPGVATGRVSFSVTDAIARARRGEKVILVRVETSAEDIAGIRLAQGVLTARGGMTSHAAVVARGLGRCAVVGAGALQIDPARQQLTVRERSRGPGSWPGIAAEPDPSSGELDPLEPRVVRAGDVVTIDGSSGAVLSGAAPLRAPEVRGQTALARLLAWADELRGLRVYAYAEDETDTALAAEIGADGLLGRRADGSLHLGDAPCALVLGTGPGTGPAGAPAGAIDFGALPAAPYLAIETGDTADAVTAVEACIAAARAARPGVALGLLDRPGRPLQPGQPGPPERGGAPDRSEAGLPPAWVEMAARLRLDFVACAPLRTPIARLVAAQTALRLDGL